MDPYFYYHGIDYRRVQKARKMLNDDQFAMYSQVTADTLFGIVRSQTNPNLIYASYLRADGSFACHTQKLNPCGGLRGQICKHILTLIGYLSSQYEVRQVIQLWISRSIEKRPNKDKGYSSFILQEYQQATRENIPLLKEGIDPVPFNVLHQSDQIVTVRPSKVRILDIQPNEPLIEVHLAIDSKSKSTSQLELTNVMCLGDRSRILFEDAQANNWQKCNNCTQWFCPDCLQAFQNDSSECPSVLFGYNKHKFSLSK